MYEQALDILTTYLTDTEVAPLNKRFVEIAKPLCTAIGFYSSDRASASEITCHISGVPAAMLEKMTSELKSALREIAQGTAKEGALDMKRMQSVIERDRRQLLATAETRLTDVLCDPVITGQSECHVLVLARRTKLIRRLPQTFCTVTSIPSRWRELSRISTNTRSYSPGTPING